MARQPSWETVARALGARMEHYAHCSAHSKNNPDLDGCPFCQDRAAWQMYADKIGHTRAPGDHPYFDNTVAVPVDQIKASPAMKFPKSLT